MAHPDLTDLVCTVDVEDTREERAGRRNLV